MGKYRFSGIAVICIAGTLLVGCGIQMDKLPTGFQKFTSNISRLTASFLHLHSGTVDSSVSVAVKEDTNSLANKTASKSNVANTNTTKTDSKSSDNTLKTVTDPENVDVLVNKVNALPANYQPPDLVTPNIPWLYQDSEIHLMRKVAANALEQLVAGAKKDGIDIVGVSAFRSYGTQVTIYNQYVSQQGEQAANQFSAKPGTSEHQTGLAIDVCDSSGKYAVEDGFANLPAAKWLADHAPEYGFVIRYPKGKEAITGYQYEPWHIRYVGKDIAMVMQKNGWTLEEYMQHQGSKHK